MVNEVSASVRIPCISADLCLFRQNLAPLVMELNNRHVSVQALGGSWGVRRDRRPASWPAIQGLNVGTAWTDDCC